MRGITCWTLRGGRGVPFADAALFDDDCQPTIAGEAVISFIKRHRTALEGKTDKDGILSFNGYKGAYEISVRYKDKTVTMTYDFKDHVLNIVLP